MSQCEIIKYGLNAIDNMKKVCMRVFVGAAILCFFVNAYAMDGNVFNSTMFKLDYALNSIYSACLNGQSVEQIGHSLGIVVDGNRVGVLVQAYGNRAEDWNALGLKVTEDNNGAIRGTIWCRNLAKLADNNKVIFVSSIIDVNAIMSGFNRPEGGRLSPVLENLVLAGGTDINMFTQMMGLAINKGAVKVVIHTDGNFNYRKWCRGEAKKNNGATICYVKLQKLRELANSNNVQYVEPYVKYREFPKMEFHKYTILSPELQILLSAYEHGANTQEILDDYGIIHKEGKLLVEIKVVKDANLCLHIASAVRSTGKNFDRVEGYVTIKEIEQLADCNGVEYIAGVHIKQTAQTRHSESGNRFWVFIIPIVVFMVIAVGGVVFIRMKKAGK